MSRMRQKRKARAMAERAALAAAGGAPEGGGDELGEAVEAAGEEAEGEEAEDEEAEGEEAEDEEAEDGAAEPGDSAEDADAGIDHPHDEVPTPEATGEPAGGLDGEPDGEPGGEPGGELGGEPDGDEEADPDADLEPVRGISPERLKMIVESLLFASDKPLPLTQLRHLTGERNLAAIQAALDSLVEDYKDRGVVLGELAGGYQFRTHPTSAEYVQRLIAGRPVRLSRAQLETLAIIAYRQPVTRPEIDEIRGVDCGGTLKILLDRSLIRVLGKKEEPGRPLLYGTSKEFLEFFNLKDLRDLPTLREFHELSEESMRVVEKLDADASDGEEGGGGASGEEPEASAAAASAG